METNVVKTSAGVRPPLTAVQASSVARRIAVSHPTLSHHKPKTRNTRRGRLPQRKHNTHRGSDHSLSPPRRMLRSELVIFSREPSLNQTHPASHTRSTRPSQAPATTGDAPLMELFMYCVFPFINATPFLCNFVTSFRFPWGSDGWNNSTEHTRPLDYYMNRIAEHLKLCTIYLRAEYKPRHMLLSLIHI